MKQTLPFECGVSLSRDEYLRSQELISKRSGGMGLLFGSGLMSAAILVLCVLFFLFDYKQNGRPDFALLGLLILLIVVEVTTVFRFPKMQRKLAAKSYDQTLFSGYSFDGVLHVGAVDIQKTTKDGVTSISYFTCPLFIEAEDMMIFCAAQGRSIVIPARFLTEEDAEALRELVFLNVPAQRRRMIGKLVPSARERMPLPVLVTEEAEQILTISLEYTKKEAVDLFDDSLWTNIRETMPQKVLLSAGAAMIAYLLSESLILIPVFGLALLLSVLLPFLTTRIKFHRAIKESNGAILKGTVSLTDRGLLVKGGSGKQQSNVPWNYITRAVERPSYVDYYYADEKIVSIPKRCIDDMDELRRITDEKME